MTQTTQQTTGRKVETTLRVAAPVEAVWKALTDAEELMRWFPLKARVKPGLGGAIFMSWEGEFEGEEAIKVWDPPRHLQMTFGPPAIPTLVDFYLEGAGGQTVLRLVHHGFGSGGSWDDHYDSVCNGWAFELRGLRHYLEKHAGKDRRVARARMMFDCPLEDAWRRVTGAEGLGLGELVKDLREGSAYSLKTASGLAMRGRVALCNPPKQFSGTVESANDGLFRLEVWRSCDPKTPGWQAWMWLSTYGVPQAEVTRWQECFESILKRTLG